jgi:predicted  nucleic acid-binding Zn-ribbon protein
MNFQVIGDEIQFDGYRAATFRDDLPASVRDQINCLIETYPHPDDAETVDDLRTERADLEQNLSSVERELEEAREEISDLERENKELKALLETNDIAVPA